MPALDSSERRLAIPYPNQGSRVCHQFMEHVQVDETISRDDNEARRARPRRDLARPMTRAAQAHDLPSRPGPAASQRSSNSADPRAPPGPAARVSRLLVSSPSLFSPHSLLSSRSLLYPSLYYQSTSPPPQCLPASASRKPRRRKSSRSCLRTMMRKKRSKSFPHFDVTQGHNAVVASVRFCCRCCRATFTNRH